MSALLRLDGVTKRFGGVVAVDEISFAVSEGDVLGVIGPNGAGKTTLLSLISGAQRPSRGQIVFDGGHRIDRLRPHAVARLGVARAHQVPRPFHGMTVRQNVMVAAQASGSHARKHAAWAAELCSACDIADVDRPVESLRLMELKRLGVARALALEPKLLLLDEVAAGLVGDEVTEIVELIRSVHERGVTVILVEHVQALIQELAGQVIVLDWGRKVAEGTPAAIAADREVIRVYLGDGGSRPPARSVRSGRVDKGKAARPLLAVDDLAVEYGKARALRGVGIEVAEGELVAVVGANGAGKTSLALAIAGMVRAAAGTIHFAGEDITRDAAHARARAGIALCHEGRQLFNELTVEENLRLPTDHVRRPGPTLEQRLERVYELFPVLRDRAGSPAGELSGGQQQMVAIGRALMPEPRLVIFDELSLGLAPKVIDEIFEVIPQIVDWGVAVMLIEQNVHRSLEIADRAYVIERGEVVLSGRPEDLDDVQQAYFGARASTLTTGGDG
ncbi:MAG: branched-chain amino acid transport system ATP-binding protein [Solirubrobacteraceae bacterium]